MPSLRAAVASRALGADRRRIYGKAELSGKLPGLKINRRRQASPHYFLGKQI